MSMISGGCFDNGLHRAEFSTTYEHGAGHATVPLMSLTLLHIVSVSAMASESHPKVKVSGFSNRSITIHKLNLIYTHYSRKLLNDKFFMNFAVLYLSVYVLRHGIRQYHVISLEKLPYHA